MMNTLYCGKLFLCLSIYSPSCAKLINQEKALQIP